MKLSPRQCALSALMVCMFGGSAQAAEEPGMFSLSGFATLGLVKTDTDDAQFVITGQRRGATKQVSGEVDSKLGVQLGAKFSPVFSATAQVLTRQTGDGDYTPGVEWAFAKAQLTPALSLRLGRMGLPFFAVSDFRAVGFANTTLRPAPDVYGQVPVSHFDGADATWQAGTGLGTVTAQLFGGQSKDTVGRVEVEMKKMVGFNATLELDNGLSLRVGHVAGRITVHSTPLNTLVATLRATPFASVGDQLDANSRKASFSGLGLTWDEGDWLLNAEYTQRRTESYIADTDGWYLTAGRRFGTWTPYATVSQVRTVDSNVNNTVQPLTPGLAQLRALVDGALAGQHLGQKTLAVGARWDFYRNFALKGQFERIRLNGNGFFTQAKPGFANSSVNVLSVAVDTVF
ncbi:MAG: hypothetical protein QM788_10890 [Roseateles sp.]|uniref:hypothetical protein n=1 Tax=Roseateles sp. TaxID=1971397 RepID=UPI0039E869B0